MDERKLAIVRQWLGVGSINIFGRPFAGKDTQGKKLADLFGGSLMGGGEILRNSKIPEHIDAILRKGELIPSKDYVEIVIPYLSKPEFSTGPLILSSVGRWIGEEKGVMAATTQAGHPLKAVIHLELNEEAVFERWKKLDHHDDRGGRYDDTEDILRTRLDEYRLKTLPVIDEYDQSGLLIRIDGSQSPQEVFDAILDALGKMASHK